MIVHDKPLEWYIEKLKNKEYFAQGMYGDGEWIAMFKEKIGSTNAEGTIYTQELCDELEDSLQYDKPGFLFSAPGAIKNPDWTGIGEVKVDRWLEKRLLSRLEFYEKDMWDKEMKDGKLGPFIQQLRTMNVCLISNKALRGLTFLNYDHFIELSYPNCYPEIETVADAAVSYGKEGVYLISAGLPAALLAQKIYSRVSHSFVLDVGSIWDAFVGIGAQRGWRAELYSQPDRWEEWKAANLQGIDYGNATE